MRKKLELKKNQKMLEKTQKRHKLMLSKAIIITLSLLGRAHTNPKYEIEFDSSFNADGSKEIDCSSDAWITIYSFRFENTSQGNLITIGLEKGSELANQKNLIGNKYGLFNRDSDCHVHKEPSGKNIYPVVVFVIKKKASSVNSCQVVSIITNNDIMPCSGSEENFKKLKAVIIPGGTGDKFDDFSTLKHSSADLHNSVHPIIFRIKNLAVNDIDDRIMEMILLNPLTSPRYQDPIMMYTLSHHNAINSGLSTGYPGVDTTNSQLLKKTQPQEYIPRITKGDLPGFLLGLTDSPWKASDKTLQKVFQAQSTAQSSIHVEFYIEKPLSMELDKEYRVYVSNRPISLVDTQTQKKLLQQRYSLTIIRKSTHFACRLWREAGVITPNGQIILFNLPYSNTNSNFLYFSFTYGGGILYYTSPTDFQSKILVTLSVYQPGGNRETQTVGSEHSLTVDEFFAFNQDQADRLFFQVNYIPGPGVTDNSVGLRIYRASMTEGIYPAHLISSLSNQPVHPGCYLDGYKVGECISYILLEGPSHSRMSRYSDSGTIKEMASGSTFVNSCKVPYSDSICIIPMTGYINKLETSRPDKMTGNVMLMTDFNAWPEEDRNLFYYQYTNDLNTIFLATCQNECKPQKIKQYEIKRVLKKI